MKIHLIWIWWAAMHNLAIALHLNWHVVTGSDLWPTDPARSRLAKYGLLASESWRFADRITNDIDIIILGMTAMIDNPERIRAKELWLKIMSFPEYIYEASKTKKNRIVIWWSHGKTTTTAMVMHILRSAGFKFDYLVGSIVEWFESMVQLSDADTIVIEWDEYPDSKINLTPKFHIYSHTIWVLNGIWRDHINIYDTFEKYMKTFEEFANMTPNDGVLYYYDDDKNISQIIHNLQNPKYKLEPYSKIPYIIKNHQIYIIDTNWNEYPTQIIWEHNMQNLAAAQKICYYLWIWEKDFYSYASSFESAYNRLNKIYDADNTIIYRDFAHNPAKLVATIQAVRQIYPDHKLMSIYELHTFSSLQKSFLPEYAHTMEDSDISIVYFDHHALAVKRLPNLEFDDIKSEFANADLQVFDDSHDLSKYIHNIYSDFKASGYKTVLLYMSSGTFGWLDIMKIIQ